MKKILPFLLVILLLAAVVAEWFLLPDPVQVSFGFPGETEKTMPKILVLAMTAAISILGAYQIIGVQGEDRKLHQGGYVMLLIASVLIVVTLAVNVWLK